MAVKTTPFDAAQYIDTPEAQDELLRDAFASNDAHYIANALGVVARARGMTQVAKNTDVTREALYKALSTEGDPKLSTFLSVLQALHLQIVSPLNTADKFLGLSMGEIQHLSWTKWNFVQSEADAVIELRKIVSQTLFFQSDLEKTVAYADRMAAIPIAEAVLDKSRHGSRWKFRYKRFPRHQIKEPHQIGV